MGKLNRRRFVLRPGRCPGAAGHVPSAAFLAMLALTGTLGRLGPRRAYLGAPLVLAAAVLGRRLLLVSGAGWVYRLLWIIVTLAFLAHVAMQGIALWGTAGGWPIRQAKRLSPSSPPAASWAPWWAAW